MSGICPSVYLLACQGGCQMGVSPDRLSFAMREVQVERMEACVQSALWRVQEVNGLGCPLRPWDSLHSIGHRSWAETLRWDACGSWVMQMLLPQRPSHQMDAMKVSAM